MEASSVCHFCKGKGWYEHFILRDGGRKSSLLKCLACGNDDAYCAEVSRRVRLKSPIPEYFTKREPGEVIYVDFRKRVRVEALRPN